MAAWLDTFTGVLAIATGADVGGIGVGGESLIGLDIGQDLLRVYCSTSSIDLIFLAFEFLSVFQDI